GAERDLVPAEMLRVSGSVVALVVVPDRGNGVLEEAEPVDDAGALVRVALHQPPLLRVEPLGLQQDRIRNRELADVVEERRVPEQVELALREPELASDRE